MNTETGEMKIYSESQVQALREIGVPLVPWSIGEVVELKGCFFRVHTINTKGSRVTFKGISRAEYERDKK